MPNNFFISCSNEDMALGQRVSQILNNVGMTTTLQNPDHNISNHMASIDEEELKNTQVIALISPDYLSSSSCVEDIHSVFNSVDASSKNWLLPLRTGKCNPAEMLSAISYLDFNSLCAKGDEDAFKKALLAAVRPESDQENNNMLKDLWRETDPLIHSKISHIPYFFGRQQELKDLSRHLPESKIIVVTQKPELLRLGGIGKTTLVRHYAYTVRHDYVGVWWLDGATTSSIIRGFIELGQRFFPSLPKEANRHKAAQAVVDLIAKDNFTRPFLLIFDNVDHQESMQSFIPDAGAHVLVTSRNSWAESFAQLQLDLFSQASAVEYLLNATDRTAQTGSEASAAQLAATLGNLPLALHHAAAYCRQTDTDFDQYIRLVSNVRIEASKEAEDFNGVQATFALSFNKAIENAEGAGKVMGLFAFLDASEIRDALITESVMDTDKRDQAIAVLNDYGLLEGIRATEAMPVTMMHSPVQRAIRYWLKHQGEEEKQAGAALVLIAYALPLGEKQVDEVDWPVFESLLPHAKAVLENVPHHDDMAVQIAFLLGRLSQYLITRADYTEAEPMVNWALQITEASYGSDHPAVTVHLENLAVLLKKTRRFEEAGAAYQRIMRINEQCFGKDHPEMISDLNNLTELQLLEATYRLAEVEPLAARAVETLEQYEQKTNSRHPKYMFAKRNLEAIRAQLAEHIDAAMDERSLPAPQQSKLSDLGEKWYIDCDGEKQGPISQQELRQLISEGKINSSDLLCRENTDLWLRFDQLMLHSHDLLRALRD